MNLLIPAAAGLGLLLLASSSKASPATSTTKPLGSGGGGGTTKKTATDFQIPIATALSANDTDALMAIANQMQAAGLTEEAQALRTVALNLKTLGRSPGQPGVTPSPSLPNPPLIVVPPVVSPSSIPLPAGVPASSPQAQRMQIAQAMAVDLRNTSRYKENTGLVKRFQEQEGLLPDGKYGPKSGYALAELGIIPPRPRYWTRKTVQADKKKYSEEMLTRAATDPSRAADWTAASKVANDPVT
jgi:hypothetical protein